MKERSFGCSICGEQYDPLVFSETCPHSMRDPFIFDDVLPIIRSYTHIPPENVTAPEH